MEILNHSESLIQSAEEIKIAGRMISMRVHGKSLFFNLLDESGKIQVYVKSDEVGETNYQLFDFFDIGDLIGIEGKVFKTKTGETTVKAKNFTLLAKSLRPLPEKWHGLHDKELRYRQRYLDLLVTPGVKEIFLKRTQIIQAIREYLDRSGFREVETPILQPVYGGAFARPFKTFHNALNAELYLRIADELYLKRLLIGSFEKVYEFCKDFRNEGMDKNHNPEFTMVELYAAYWDYRDVMNFYQELLIYVAQTVLESLKFTYQTQEIDLTPPWRKMTYYESVKEKTGIDVSQKSFTELQRISEQMGLKITGTPSKVKVLDELFAEKVQPALIQPTFITDYPLEMSPLAKKHRHNPELTERFELFIAGFELGNAFSELNDPLEQRKRFEEQMELRKKGEEEAQVLDEDFLKALEFGMPPSGGLGFGIDRLVMLLTDAASIREVILFPQMRPEE